MANEKRLIDANAVLAGIETFMQCYAEKEKELTPFWVKVAVQALDMVRQFIKKMPTVDAVEAEHGYWIDSTSVDHMGRVVEHGIDCSVCESVFKDDSSEVVKRWKERFKVCPFCGAKMGGGNEDG